MKNILFLSLLLFVSLHSSAAENYQGGKISDITVTTAGLMVKLDTGLPLNCNGTPYGWMLIEQKNTALTSVVLAVWVSQNKEGTIYTSGRLGGTGYCLVNQFDPVN